MTHFVSSDDACILCVCTYLALETTPYLYVNGFCTGCDPAKKAVADRFSPANHPLTAKVCPNVHVCVHVCVLCVYMCVYCVCTCVCTCVRTVCVHVCVHVCVLCVYMCVYMCAYCVYMCVYCVCTCVS